MTDRSDQPPAGRYGRSVRDDARTDRRLKILGAVLGAGSLGLIVWFGVAHVSSGSDVSAELIKFWKVSGEEVRVHLEVRKDPDITGVCALRALSEDKAEVGRADYTFPPGESRIDEVVSLRTTAEATTAELVRCNPAERD